MKKLIRIILLIQIIWLSQNEAVAELHSTPGGWKATTDWRQLQVESVRAEDGRIFTRVPDDFAPLLSQGVTVSDDAKTRQMAADTDLVGYVGHEGFRPAHVTRIVIQVNHLPGGQVELIMYLRARYLDNDESRTWGHTMTTRFNPHSLESWALMGSPFHL